MTPTPTQPCPECAKLRGERAKINTHVRLFDLVRYSRASLHEDGLITDEEYGWLCGGPMAMSPRGGSPSRERLEDYDELAATLKTATAELERLRKLVEWQPIETAPKDGKFVVGWFCDEADEPWQTSIAKRGKSGNIVSVPGYWTLNHAAKWLPLPPESRALK